MLYVMQARSSTSGALVAWGSPIPDFGGAYWPGPGSPLDIAIAQTARAASVSTLAIGAQALQYLTVPFTAPSLATNWTLAGASVSALAPVDVPGVVPGVLFTAPTGGAISVPTHELTTPGGDHGLVTGAPVVLFIAEQIQPASNVDVRAHLGVLVMGTSLFTEIKLCYDGDGTGVKSVGHRRSNTDYQTGNVSLSTPWALYKGGSPFAGAWWRLSFDDTNLKVERNQIGGGADYPGEADGNVGAWEVIWSSSAHGCGAIQRVGLSVRSSADNPFAASAILLSSTGT